MVRYLLFFLILIVSCEKKTKISYYKTDGDRLYNEGEQLLQKNSVEAYLKFQKALYYFNKEKDSSNISKSLICQAIAQKQTGDVFGAETTLVEALTFMKDDDESLYSVYGNMGDLKYDQKEYPAAEDWYNKALKEKISFAQMKYSILNNKAASEYRQGKYSNALRTLLQIDLLKVESVKVQGKIRENIVYTKWLQNNNYPASKEFENLLNFKLKNNDMWGVNSSYSHLAEINQNTNPDASLFYARKMLSTAEELKSPEDRLEALERISLVDDPSNARKNFELYKKLSDSIQKYKNDNRNRFAYIKYDSEKKEIENQRLKVKNAENDIEILKRNIGIASLFLLLIGSITGGSIWFKRRKKRLQHEKEIEIKNTQLKISKKVHDVVANGLYHMMIDVQNNPEMDKTKILNDIEKMYEESRDISHENIAEKDFAPRFINMITSYSTDEQKVLPVGYKESIWESISYNTQLELYYILREILVNMKKHSHAKLASVKFEKDDYNLKIRYTDNGVGIKDLHHKKGTGIHNTENRIESVGGDIIFEKNPTGGLIVRITIPIQPKYV